MTPAQTESKPRGSRFTRFVRRTWKPLVVVIVVLVVIHGIATMILGRRFEADIRALKAKGEPVSAAELGGPKVPDDQNAAVIYAKSFRFLKDYKTLKSLELVYQFLRGVGAIPTKWPAKPVVWADAKRVAQQFQPVLPLVQEALSRPKCQFPVKWDTGPGATFIHLAYLRSLTRVLSAMAVVDAHDGKLDEAYKKVSMAFQVAKAAKDEPILISTLVTISCTQTANGALQAVLKYGQPSSSSLQELEGLLRDTDYRPQWVNAMKGERASGLWIYNYLMQHGDSAYCNLVHTLDGSEEPSALKLKFLKMLNPLRRPFLYADAGHYLKYMAATVASSGEPYRIAIQSGRKIEESLKSLPQYAYVARTLSPVYTMGSSKVDEARAQTALTQLLLAALQYKSHNGAYPETISQLRSKASWDIPTDPFSGKEFVYKRTPKGFLAYSIGTDLKDDGGRPLKIGKDYDKGGDIVLDWGK